MVALINYLLFLNMVKNKNFLRHFQQFQIQWRSLALICHDQQKYFRLNEDYFTLKWSCGERLPSPSVCLGESNYYNRDYSIFLLFYRLWFHFTVENTQKDQRVIFNVVNLSKWRTLFSDGLTPVVKSTSRPRWQRMQGQFVFYYRSPIHSDHFILSFAFSFDREDERYSFALAQPYSLSRYNLYLESILSAKHIFLRCEAVAKSLQVRNSSLEDKIQTTERNQKF